MLGLFLAGWVELISGAKVICSEANTVNYDAKVAVGASIKNRSEEWGKHPIEIMFYPRAYSNDKCSDDMLTIEHFAAYLDGKFGKGPKWTKDVFSFSHPKLYDKLHPTWSKRGLKIIKRTNKVDYWKKV